MSDPDTMASTAGDGRPDSVPVDFKRVLAAEHEAISRRRLEGRADPRRAGPPADLFGIALSGGGIRSASFCLGALQALHQKGLIDRADYLSTVSGGGYTGAAMVAGMTRPSGAGQEKGVFPFKASAAADGGDIRDSEPVSHLRDNSRYLAPKGIGDILISLTIILRGLMVNFLLVLSVLLPMATLAILANPTTDHLHHSVLYDMAHYLRGSAAYDFVAGLCGCTPLGARGQVVLRGLLLDPLVASKTVALLLALWLIGWALWRSYVEGYKPLHAARIFEPGSQGTRFGYALFLILIGALLFEAQPIILAALIEFALRDTGNLHGLQSIGAAAAAIVATTATFRDRLIGLIQKALGSATLGARFQAALARIAFWAVGLALPVLIYGLVLLLVAWGMHVRAPPGSASGYVFAPALLVRPDLWLYVLAVLVMFLVGRTALLLYRRPQPGRIADLLEMLWRTKRKRYLLGFLAFIVIAWFSAVATRSSEPGAGLHWSVLLTYLSLTLLVLTVGYNFTENANGLHRLYRDRISAAFRLGSDESGNPLGLHELDDSAPYLLINAALNVRRDGDDHKRKRTAEGRTMAAPQEMGPSAAPKPDPAKRGRNAEFFLFSRYYVGSDATDYSSAKAMREVVPQLDLATAVAISGAAVSSSMGRIGIGLLGPTLALLNLRLGFWLTNPRYLAERLASGTIGDKTPDRKWDDILRLYLFAEAFGRMSSGSSRIYITDGGHIDNIGLYQLLKRRCKFIVVVDAEADQGMNFGAFCDVQRFARIDEGVRITLDWQPVRRAALARAAEKTKGVDADADVHDRHFAIGRILYEKVGATDGESSEEGTLIYVKATVTGDEPDYVLDYERRYPQFPHESTGDQFFSEEQMEAYRALGFHAVTRALTIRNKARRSAAGPQPGDYAVERMMGILTPARQPA